MAVTLLWPQFSFHFFFFLILQFRQFNCHNSIFSFLLAISLSKFLFLSPTSVTSFLSPLSYFFLRISTMVLPKFAYFLIFPNNFQLYPYHKINSIFCNIQPKDSILESIEPPKKIKGTTTRVFESRESPKKIK